MTNNILPFQLFKLPQKSTLKVRNQSLRTVELSSPHKNLPIITALRLHHMNLAHVCAPQRGSGFLQHTLLRKSGTNLKKVTELPANTENSVAKQTGPKGVGMAVAFDWGLAVQILAGPAATRFIGQSTASTSTILVNMLLMLPFASLIAIFGEGVRRGWHWTRIVQLVINTLVCIGGFFILYRLFQTSRHGNFWPLVTVVITLVFSPLIAWRMHDQATINWYKTVTTVQARQRHGGVWPWLIAIWAIAGGILQAVAAVFPTH